ncbi:hypothetical protein C8R46DRAFT_1038063 [Mycena filopes]|nr:hypothetical protein C8R46DRAFT_1038063 [Mycena filopes]
MSREIVEVDVVERQLIGVVTSRDGIDDEHVLLTITILKGFGPISSPHTTTTPTIAERPTLVSRRCSTIPPPPAIARTHKLFFTLTTTMSTTGVRECPTFVSPSSSDNTSVAFIMRSLMFTAVLALTVAVQTPPTDPLRRPPRLRRLVGHLKQTVRRCIISIKQAAGRAPTLKALYVPPPPLVARSLSVPNSGVPAGAKRRSKRTFTPGSLRPRGPGARLRLRRRRQHVLADFDAGRITHDALLANLWVKIGQTEDLVQRQDNYRRCGNGGQTHLWLWCFRVERRCVGERLSHLLCDRIASRAGLECTGCPRRHRDYLKLSTLGFKNLTNIMKDAFTQLGEPDLVPIELGRIELKTMKMKIAVPFSQPACSWVSESRVDLGVHLRVDPGVLQKVYLSAGLSSQP